MLIDIKQIVFCLLLDYSGFKELRLEPVEGDTSGCRFRPANRLTAYCIFACKMGIELPDPHNLQGPWETPIGSVSFDDSTKDINLTPKKPVDFIKITFTV